MRLRMLRLFCSLIAGAGFLSAQVPVERAWTLLTAGKTEKDADKRAKAVRALGLIPNDKKAQEMAEAALKDEKLDVQVAAATALGQMGAKSSASKLVEAVKGKDSDLVFAATNSLYLLGDDRAYQVYFAVLTGQLKSGDSLMESQMKMIKDPKALAKLGFDAGMGFVPFGGAAVTAFKTVTKDDASPVRAAAAAKLVRDPDPKTSEALGKAASDKKWLVRAAAVDAIAKRGDPSLLSAVMPLLTDENDTVRFTAAATVIRLSAKR